MIPSGKLIWLWKITAFNRQIIIFSLQQLRATRATTGFKGDDRFGLFGLWYAKDMHSICERSFFFIRKPHSISSFAYTKFPSCFRSSLCAHLKTWAMCHSRAWWFFYPFLGVMFPYSNDSQYHRPIIISLINRLFHMIPKIGWMTIAIHGPSTTFWRQLISWGPSPGCRCGGKAALGGWDWWPSGKT